MTSCEGGKPGMDGGCKKRWCVLDVGQQTRVVAMYGKTYCQRAHLRCPLVIMCDYQRAIINRSMCTSAGRDGRSLCEVPRRVREVVCVQCVWQRLYCVEHHDLHMLARFRQEIGKSSSWVRAMASSAKLVCGPRVYFGRYR